MTSEFEYMNYEDDDQADALENRAVEFERHLAGARRSRTPQWANVATPEARYTEAEFTDPTFGEPGYPEDATFVEDGPYLDEVPEEEAPVPAAPRPRAGGRPPTSVRTRGTVREGGPTAAGPARGGSPGLTERTGRGGSRTQSLISNGRPRGRRSRTAWVLNHWRLVSVAAGAALLAGLITGLTSSGGTPASWPSSVTTVQAEIKQACENPDTAAEPSGTNFACDSDTQAVLWVFSLLTSGNNPGYVDQGTGRKGLEPIQPAQGGDIAWSLNLHHPYDASDPVDSLAVAARAINNIISGATLTSSSGTAQVEAGLLSKGSNCQRYTGSAQLVTRTGYPARCASAVSSGSGQAALVTDVFKQWMGSSAKALASEAGVLFTHSSDPGNSQVRAILQSLPASGG